MKEWKGRKEMKEKRVRTAGNIDKGKKV